jgi:hypothetical protein
VRVWILRSAGVGAFGVSLYLGWLYFLSELSLDCCSGWWWERARGLGLLGGSLDESGGQDVSLPELREGVVPYSGRFHGGGSRAGLVVRVPV